MQRLAMGTNNRQTHMRGPALFGDEMKDLYASSPDKSCHAAPEQVQLQEEKPKEEKAVEEPKEQQVERELHTSPAEAEEAIASGEKRKASVPTPETTSRKKRICQKRVENQIPFLLR